MASSFLPPSSTTTTPPSTTSTSTSPARYFLRQPKHFPTNKKSTNFRKIVCNSKQNDDRDQSSHEKFDRRNVLIGAGLYGATALTSSPFAFSAPISAPDVTKCGPADLPQGVTPTNCCPPPMANIVDYKFPTPPRTLRIRPAAHLADEAYIAKFNRALQLMRALPDTDPRSFKQQANVHCAYCDGAYDQAGLPNLEFQVHNSWLFFPFHRYLKCFKFIV